MTIVKAKDSRKLVELVTSMRKHEEFYRQTNLTRHSESAKTIKQRIDQLIEIIHNYQ